MVQQRRDEIGIEGRGRLNLVYSVLEPEKASLKLILGIVGFVIQLKR